MSNAGLFYASAMQDAMEVVRRIPQYAQHQQQIAPQLNYLQRHYPSLAPKQTELWSDGRSQIVVAFGGTLPVPISGKVYNIPVEIYVPHGFPQLPPLAFVRPTREMMIQATDAVRGEDGQVFLPYLHTWSPQTHTLLQLAQEMIGAFGRAPPVYARPPSQPYSPPAVPLAALSPSQWAAMGGGAVAAASTASALSHWCAENPWFAGDSPGGTRAALPHDLAAGWTVYTERACADLWFYIVQSHPILGTFCAHRNHPRKIYKRVCLELLAFMYMFYMVLYYMQEPLTGWYGENGGMTLSEAVFGAFVFEVYGYIANTPWKMRPGMSEGEKRQADNCSKAFLGIMVLVSMSTLGQKAGELGKFEKSDSNYCRHCIKDASNGTAPHPNPHGYTCRPGYRGNPAASPAKQFLCGAAAGCNEYEPVTSQCLKVAEKIWIDLLLAYFVYGAAMAVMQASFRFYLWRRAYKKQYAATGGSAVPALNLALTKSGFQPLGSGAADRAVALQFVAVERHSVGNPYPLCDNTYGEVSLDAAVENYKQFCEQALQGQGGTALTMEHVCGWCGWRSKGLKAHPLFQAMPHPAGVPRVI